MRRPPRRRTVRAVHAARDGLNLVANWEVEVVQESEGRRGGVGRRGAGVLDRARELDGARAAGRVVAAHHRRARARAQRRRLHRRQLRGGVGGEDVDRHHHRHAVARRVLDVAHLSGFVLVGVGGFGGWLGWLLEGFEGAIECGVKRG